MLRGWVLRRGAEPLPGWDAMLDSVTGALRARMEGLPHTDPHPDGCWSASVTHRLALAGAPEVLRTVSRRVTFTPVSARVYASTSGAGSMYLFGETYHDSCTPTFTTVDDGTVDFTVLNPIYRVPGWAENMATEAARAAHRALAAAEASRR